jgi:hypothetical protein
VTASGVAMSRTALLMAAGLLVLSAPARAETVVHETDIKSIRLGQHILVDDATCPNGQIKEVVGKKLSPAGVLVTKSCVSRRTARAN